MAPQSVLGILSSLAGFIKVRFLVDKAIIDNTLFRLHYRTTSAILFSCCLILSANGLIGDPILCVTQKEIQAKVMNTYCWITSTFSLFNASENGDLRGLGNPEGEEKRYHNYYQWVPFVLFIQGLLFYLPHWLWKNWEGGKMKMLSHGIRGAVAVGSTEKRKEKIEHLAQYLVDSLKTHKIYAVKYFTCELLNLINVIGNMFLLDKFLGGSFWTYGIEVINFAQMDQIDRIDPMIKIFPRMTKCTFNKYGHSGTLEVIDALCVLPLNILNEKIFIFLWFWFILLTFFSLCAVIYSAVILCWSRMRKMVLKKRFHYKSSSNSYRLIAWTQAGDFLFLHHLGQNMDSFAFREVLDEFIYRLRTR